MNHFAGMAFAIVVAMGLFIWLCLPGARSRVIATTVFTLLTMGAFAANVESTGQPKPVALEWRDISEAELVGLAWDEAQHLVWIWIREEGPPRAYVLPWPEDKKKFGQLQDQWRRRGATGDEFQYDAEGEVAKVVPPKPMAEKAGG
jgi:hypothetical protein